ncbi:MAG TPA: tRNA lysidine(34) synthetase TilS [Solirubrobacteraceae bacterium]|nr:tRNA lysidine(34) synthetase TilS [Solirubrobacteraceae bacterium]
MSAPSAAGADELRELVREQGLLSGPRAVVAMLSGGRDSVCLLDIAVALRGPREVRALHVNYGLRDLADEDERHCARLCDALGVELRVVRPGRGSGHDRAGGNAPSAQPPRSGNVQAWAREVRYRAAEQLAVRGDAAIASGHTASDQVETILYRLAASPGRRALLGMSAADSTPSGHALVRPLLGFTRDQTGAYCRELNLVWRDDASNSDLQYARSRVRLGLVPALSAVHPAAEANVLRTARLLREEAALLDSLVHAEIDDAGGIALERLEQLPAPLARLVVVRLAEQAAGTYVPQAGPRVAELLALGRRGGRAEVHVGGGAGAVIEHGRLRMVKLAPRPERGTVTTPVQLD